MTRRRSYYIIFTIEAQEPGKREDEPRSIFPSVNEAPAEGPFFSAGERVWAHA